MVAEEVHLEPVAQPSMTATERKFLELKRARDAERLEKVLQGFADVVVEMFTLTHRWLPNHIASVWQSTMSV
jgi:hypothetical protein